MSEPLGPPPSPPGPPGPPQPPAPPGPPAPPAPPAAAAEPPKKKRTGLKITIAAVVVALLAGGGYAAYAAYDKLSGGGTQPHDVLPADTAAYVRFDLDPSASQKISLLKLIKRVPDLADELGIESEDDDIRRLIVEAVASQCDLDWEDDLEPWIGDRIGVGIGEDLEEFDIRIAVQVKDEKAAEKGVESLFDCGDEDFGIAFIDDYAIITPTQKQADAAVKAAEKESLADDETFAADYDALGDPGLVSAWVNLDSQLAETFSEGFFSEFDPEAAEAFQDQIPEDATFSLALRASDDSLEIVGSGPGGEDIEKVDGGLAALPEDTAVAFSFAGSEALADQFVEGFRLGWDLSTEFGSGFEDDFGFEEDFGLEDDPFADDPFAEEDPSAEEDPFAATPLTPEEQADLREILGEEYDLYYDAEGYPVDPFEDESSEYYDDGYYDDPTYGSDVPSYDELLDLLSENYDIDLEDDLKTLLGGTFTFYLGSDGLADVAEMESPEDIDGLPAGFVLSADGADDLAERIVTAIEDSTGLSLASGDGDNGAVLATGKKTVDALSEDGGLGDTDAFGSVIDDASLGGLFINVGAILDAIREANPPRDVEEVLDQVGIVKAIGISGSADGDRSTFRLKVSFTEEK